MNYKILRNSVWLSDDVDDPEKAYENNIIYNKLDLLVSFVETYPYPLSYVIISDIVEESSIDNISEIITGEMIEALVTKTLEFFPCYIQENEFSLIVKQCINISMVLYKTKGKITSNNLFSVNEEFIDHIYDELNAITGCNVQPSFKHKLKLAEILDIKIEE